MCLWHRCIKQQIHLAGAQHSCFLGPVSISDKMSYCKITQSIEAARVVFRIVWSFYNLTVTSAAVLPIWLSNSTAIKWFKLPISQLRDFRRSTDKTSYRILKWGSVSHSNFWVCKTSCEIQGFLVGVVLLYSDLPLKWVLLMVFVLLSNTCVP